jgi:hypothetical protein
MWHLAGGKNNSPLWQEMLQWAGQTGFYNKFIHGHCEQDKKEKTRKLVVIIRTIMMA